MRLSEESLGSESFNQDVTDQILTKLKKPQNLPGAIGRLLKITRNWALIGREGLPHRATSDTAKITSSLKIVWKLKKTVWNNCLRNNNSYIWNSRGNLSSTWNRTFWGKEIVSNLNIKNLVPWLDTQGLDEYR